MQRAAPRVALALMLSLPLACSCNGGGSAPAVVNVLTAPPPVTPYACGTSAESQIVGRTFSSIQLVTDTAGWALIGGRLNWTDDGGESWRDITPAGLTPWNAGGRKILNEKAFFISATTGWLVAVRPGPEGLDSPSEIAVWRTTDTGGSWGKSVIEGAPAPSDYLGPPTVPVMAMHFIDPQRDWLATEYAGGMHATAPLFTTSDGGATWSPLPGLQGYHSGSGVIRFVNASDGWWIWGGGDRETLFATHDGGRSWEPQSLDPPGGYDPPTTYTGIHFDDDGQDGGREGALAAELRPSDEEGTSRATGLYVTHDGGSTWSFASLAPDDGSISLATADTWGVADADKLHLTEDAGVTWSAISVGWSELDPLIGIGETCSVEPLMLSFVDARAGWAVLGSKHAGPRAAIQTEVLLSTNDGGESWTELGP
jgi:photosystem II stability/assembly factor-like uncharacterized protein